MSLFDVIAAGKVDIYDPENLPKAAVDNWRKKLCNFVMNLAKDIEEPNGSVDAASILIATQRFMNGEIDKEELHAIEQSQRTDTRAQMAAYETLVFCKKNYPCHDFLLDYMPTDIIYPMYWAGIVEDISTDTCEYCKELAEKMLMEELMAYDSEEFCD